MGPALHADAGSGRSEELTRSVEEQPALTSTAFYYRDLCFKVTAYADGEPREIGDGGFTDWTARLTANAKERLLILGLSTDRLAAFAPSGQGR